MFDNDSYLVLTIEPFVIFGFKTSSREEKGIRRIIQNDKSA